MQKAAFEMFHQRGLSYQQISRELDCPLGTVKTWVHRARQQLIDRLRAREVIPTRPNPTARKSG
jgi:RNA polymerase sigma-70 factor (ECF subfamily)